MITTLKIKQGLRNLIFGKSAVDFEDQLSLLTSISISFILILSTVFNSVAGLKNSLVISSAAGMLLYFCLYLWGRIAGFGRVFYWVIGLVSLFYADLIWFVNYGSKGPIMPLFVVLYAYMILVFSRKQFVLISVLLYLNTLLLFVIELVFSEEMGDYPDATTRIVDNYMGIVFCFLIIYSFLAAIKRNYIREFERAKMSDQLKSAFVANMSHEIRTPLNAIVGFSSLMTDPDIEEKEKKIFEEQVERNSNYLLNLIEDIIDVSKLESNQLAVKVQDVDVVPLIRQISQAFQLSVNPGKNVVVVNRLGTSKMVVRVDPVRFGQILRNLLSNAVKFTEEGEIEVGCIKENGFFVFSVKDSGIGIHAEHHQAIFDRFFKIENNTNLYPGTGIGLFLSKQLVEMFGGRIWVESEVGKGANFYFTIPE